MKFQRIPLGELASNSKIILFLLLVFFSVNAHPKDFVVHLDVSPFGKSIEHLLEADDFVLKMVTARGLFKETLDGKIEPELVDSHFFNPVSGEISLFIKKSYWSNGEKISTKQVVSSLKYIENNKFKKQFFNCVEGGTEGLVYKQEEISFKWLVDKPNCTNPYEILSHQGLYIYYKNSTESIKSYLKSYPLSSRFKFLKSEKMSLLFKSLDHDLTLKFVYNATSVSPNTIYKRVSLFESDLIHQSLSSGYTQTISFETLGLTKKEKESLECISDKIFKNLNKINKGFIKAYSYSFQTTEALGLRKPYDHSEKCSEFNKEVIVSEQFLSNFPVIVKALKEQLKVRILPDKKWKEKWLNEKLPITIRLQKVRTNSIHSLFFSYFLSGISPYKKISNMLKRQDWEKQDKNKLIKVSLKQIRKSGYFVPIIHLPSLVYTSPKCVKNSSIDIYFDFHEYLRKCREI